MDQAPHILLVNPWIHDFAAYDFWAKPYGLLSLGAILRAHGLIVSYIDCLDRYHPRARQTAQPSRHGRGPYIKTPIAKPAGLKDIPRTYSRYGIPPVWFRRDALGLGKPDLILVTSLMTYWYPGVLETIGMLKEIFPNVPLVLGGIYARLCTAHARRCSGADEVVADRGESLRSVIHRFTGFMADTTFENSDLDALPYPVFDLQHRIDYVPLLTGRGCPFDCAYCASGFLEPGLRRRSPQSVLEEIDHWHRKYQVTDFAFYDDALLLDAEHHALPILEGIVRKGLPLRFHTPNALHIRAVTAETARMMHRAGFHTVRLGLETAMFEDRCTLDRKVTCEEFRHSVEHLRTAGFHPGQIGAYLLVGLPGERPAEVEHSIRAVQAAGITPVPAHYSPIPHTRLWKHAVAASRYDLEADPVFSNNAIFPCRREGFDWPFVSRLKQQIRGRQSI